MPFLAPCPHCNTGVELSAGAEGAEVVCPTCGEIFVAQRGVPRFSAPTFSWFSLLAWVLIAVGIAAGFWYLAQQISLGIPKANRPRELRR